jgi:hypothetical protein
MRMQNEFSKGIINIIVPAPSEARARLKQPHAMSMMRTSLNLLHSATEQQLQCTRVTQSAGKSVLLLPARDCNVSTSRACCCRKAPTENAIWNLTRSEGKREIEYIFSAGAAKSLELLDQRVSLARLLFLE